ncbi:MAG: glycosyltransferase [Desulfocapsa sp.]|nr:glycosyltransferase [Desulfocapsa sp.]
MKSTPQCSIIIISYNHYDDTTGPCLQSLRADPTKFEIIVVDNNSDEQTRQSLQQASVDDPRIKLILNPTNTGYAGGNNIGVSHSTAPLLILLNSDTRVLPDSIPYLIGLMNKHPEWSMLGPISNQSGNDQQIHTTASTPEKILAEGDHWCRHSTGFHYATDVVHFFCVMIRKKVYSQLNGLDEEFGLGYYEDIDFNYRATKSGLQLMITEDAFIYHRGSGSFPKNCSEVRKMVKRNKRLFRQKQGHGIIAAHWRIKNIDALERYADASPAEFNSVDLRFKFRNRYTLAKQLIPNSPLKKFFYFRRLKQVKTRFIAAFQHY